MIQSMTGFGKSLAALRQGRLSIEIQSVNRRFLEISVSLPAGFSYLEMDIRKMISSHVARGFVTVRVHLTPLQEKGSFTPSFELLKSMKEDWEILAGRLGFSKESVNLSFLLNQMMDVQSEEEVPFSQIKQPLEKALEAFNESRKKEGTLVFKEIIKRLSAVEEGVREIAKKAPSLVEIAKSKLKIRFQELFPKEQELEERVLREAAILAEKGDITEELDRLFSHFSQFQKSISGDGKKMDFLLQEMGREIHTIGSKSADLEIIRLIVELKAEIEKAKEQVQNIE